MGLSGLDLRILKHCSEFGVLESERGIAQKLRISPSTLSFKLRSFEDRGIITAYRLRVDFRKLGFPVMAWMFFQTDANKGITKKMADILRFPQVHVCCFLSGKYQVGAKAYFRNDVEVKSLEEKIRKITGKEYEPKTFLAENTVKAHNMHAGRKTDTVASETDFFILQEKMLDPNASLAGIAKKLELHKNTALNRWNRLIEQKIVLKKTPIINPEHYSRIGVDFSGICLFKAKQGKRHALEKKLLPLREVHELNTLNGGNEYDFLAVLRSETPHTFFTLLHSFYSQKEFSENLEDIQTNILLRTDSRRHTYLKDLKLAK